MPDALDQTRFVLPIDRPCDGPPEHLIDSTEWLTRRSEIAAENFEALKTWNPDWDESDFHHRDSASVELTFLLPCFPDQCEWEDMRGERYYDPEQMAYDVRRELLAKLRQAVRMLEEDIAERKL